MFDEPLPFFQVNFVVSKVLYPPNLDKVFFVQMIKNQLGWFWISKVNVHPPKNILKSGDQGKINQSTSHLPLQTKVKIYPLNILDSLVDEKNVLAFIFDCGSKIFMYYLCIFVDEELFMTALLFVKQYLGKIWSSLKMLWHYSLGLQVGCK